MPVPADHRSVARPLLRENAYHALRVAIVDGTLAPGERLNDLELARWLGISRTPVREALGQLERAGLVRTKPGSYTVVSSIDARETRAAQSVAAALHELAVREAAAELSDADLEAMRAANARFAAAITAGDADAALRADDEFHAVAVTASANPVIARVLEQVTPVLRRVERLRFAGLDGRGSIALHERIIAACAAGDADAAARAARTNWQTLLPLVDRAVDESAGTDTANHHIPTKGR
jgi:DNA-binding GntR family transcriptional regulator